MTERRRLEREVARIGDDERRRLGQDVHDGVCQQIAGALLRCQALERRVERNENLEQEDLQALYLLLEEAIDEAHAVAKGLCPLDPDPEALGSALRTLMKRARGITTARCEFVTAGDVRVYDLTTAHHLYRIAQEAVSNAARHSQANQIIVDLQGNPDDLLLQIRDDGKGIPNDLSSHGMGLRTMAYRAQIIEGQLTVECAPEGGTTITCWVPHGLPHLNVQIYKDRQGDN
ncbi:MAG: sensor histidine kinase [Armatimonadota bacterium]